ncbi:MAG TPA: glycoside hydrolase 43 family protein [Gemmatimonadaceae bacterium]
MRHAPSPDSLIRAIAMVLVGTFVVACTHARPTPDVWSPNVDATTYRNPIIFADYSDPDVVRVGNDFYMTASSFTSFPGLPILHSRDLVNWRIVAHALPTFPDSAFDVPQHGNGVWAPSIRYHDGRYYIYWGDPDRGIYVVRARDPRGPWDAPVLVKQARGWIDPAPLWDSDGHAYLVHAFANSRAGIKSVLHVAPLSADGLRVVGDDRLVFDGRAHHPTIEGPKFYKRDGYYYIFAPAGGVPTGWQTVLRSRSVYGPYEDRIVLEQGKTDVNGPHQGAWIETQSGEDWFVHFQDRGAYGRIVHLEPMKWIGGWPVIGQDDGGDGRGNPVLTYRKPTVANGAETTVPQTTDTFDGRELGLQWQWQANPRAEWWSLAARPGWLRLSARPMPGDTSNLWSVPSLLLQKFPAPAFTSTTRVSFDSLRAGERAGLIVMGLDYAYLAVHRTSTGVELAQVRVRDADRGGIEHGVSLPLPGSSVFLRVSVSAGAACRFAWSADGVRFTELGEPFIAREGKWIGAKVGLFAVARRDEPNRGYADFDALVFAHSD